MTLGQMLIKICLTCVCFDKGASNIIANITFESKVKITII